MAGRKVLTIVLVSVISLLSQLDMSAGNPYLRFEIHAGYSQFPNIQCYRFSDHTFTSRGDYCMPRYNYSPLKYIYEHNTASSIYQSGIYSLGIDVTIGKRSHICGDISFSETYDDANRGYALQFLPSYKFIYKPGDLCRLYGSAGIGAGFYPGFRNCSMVSFEYQLIPIGVELGRKLHGIAELGIGSVYIGMKLGLGYTF